MSTRRGVSHPYSAASAAPFATSLNALSSTRYNFTTNAAGNSTQLMTTQNFQTRMAKNLASQERHDELLGYHKLNQLIAANNQSSERVDGLRRIKRFQAQNAELAADFAIENSLEEEERRRELAEQDKSLAAALAKLNKEKFASEMEARRICDSSEELMELREKVKAAELNRTRYLQQQEREKIAAVEKARDNEHNRAIEEARRKAEDEESERAKQRALENMARREALKGQMEDREIRRQLAFEQFLREKALVDQVVKSIQEDDQKRMEIQKKKQREIQDSIAMYLKEREEWRAQEKRRAEEELRKIQEFQQLQDRRYRELMEQKQAKADRHDAILAKIAGEIEAKRKEEEEMQNLLSELYAEEAESRALAEIEAREEKIRRMRQEIIEANEYQRAWKQQKLLHQAAEEEEFRQQMMEKFAEDKRIEQMNKERRKREMAEYKAEVEKILAQRRDMYEKEIEREMAERKRQQEEAEYRLAIIEKERQKLLERFAGDLKQFMPKGVIKNEAEYERVFQDKPKNAPPSNFGKKASINSFF